MAPRDTERWRCGPRWEPAGVDTWWTVVGVVGDVRHFGLDTPPVAEVYTAFAQGPPTNPYLVLRTRSDPSALTPDVRAVLRSLDPQIPVQAVQTMNESVARSLAPRRFTLWLIGMFAAVRCCWRPWDSTG